MDSLSSSLSFSHLTNQIKLLQDYLDFIQSERTSTKETLDKLSEKLNFFKLHPLKRSRVPREALIREIAEIENSRKNKFNKREDKNVAAKLANLNEQLKGHDNYDNQSREFTATKDELNALWAQQRERDEVVKEVSDMLKKLQLCAKFDIRIDQLVSQDVPVPPERIALVLGKNGQNLQSIEEECKVSIYIDKLIGKAFIHGSVESITMAIQKLERVTLAVETQLAVAEEVVAALIVEKAALLNHLQSEFDVRIEVSKTELELTIRGRQENIHRARQSVLDIKAKKVALNITDYVLPALMGTKGSNIRRITESNKVIINFQKEENKLFVTGEAKGVHQAVMEVQQIIEEYSEKIIEMKLEKHYYVNALLGAKGAIINSIRTDSGVNLYIDNPKRTNNQEASLPVLKIHGPAYKVLRAQQLVLEKLSDFEKTVVRIEIPDPLLLGLFVGKNGSRINELKEKTGANFDIDRDGLAVFINSDNVETLELAKREVEAFLQANISKKIEIQKEYVSLLLSSRGRNLLEKLTGKKLKKEEKKVAPEKFLATQTQTQKQGKKVWVRVKLVEERSEKNEELKQDNEIDADDIEDYDDDYEDDYEDDMHNLDDDIKDDQDEEIEKELYKLNNNINYDDGEEEQEEEEEEEDQLYLRVNIDRDSGSITLKGYENDIDEGIRLIRDFIDQNYTQELDISSDDLAMLFSRKEKSVINQISKEFNVEIRTFEGRDQLKIRGRQQNVVDAASAIRKTISDDGSGCLRKIAIEPEVYGFLIGKNGSRILKIEEEFNVTTDIMRITSELRIRGEDPAKVLEAKKVVEQQLSELRLTIDIGLTNAQCKKLLKTKDIMMDSLKSSNKTQKNYVQQKAMKVNILTELKILYDVQISVRSRKSNESKSNSSNILIQLSGLVYNVREAKHRLLEAVEDTITREIFVFSSHIKLMGEQTKTIMKKIPQSSRVNVSVDEKKCLIKLEGPENIVYSIQHQIYKSIFFYYESRFVKIVIPREAITTVAFLPNISQIEEEVSGNSPTKIASIIIDREDSIVYAFSESLEISQKIVNKIQDLIKFYQIFSSVIRVDPIFAPYIHQKRSQITEIRQRFNDLVSIDLIRPDSKLLVNDILSILKEPTENINYNELNEIYIKISISSTTSNKLSSLSLLTDEKKEENEKLITEIKNAINEIFEQIKRENIEMEVPTETIRFLIGRSGENIKQIQEQTNTSIHFEGNDKEEQNKKNNLFDQQRHQQNTNTIVKIQGSENGVKQAQELITQSLERWAKQNKSFEIPLPPKSAATVIGQGGATIRELTEKSGANRIDIDKERLVAIVRGAEESFEKARELINTLLLDSGLLGQPEPIKKNENIEQPTNRAPVVQVLNKLDIGMPIKKTKKNKKKNVFEPKKDSSVVTTNETKSNEEEKTEDNSDQLKPPAEEKQSSDNNDQSQLPPGL